VGKATPTLTTDVRDATNRSVDNTHPVAAGTAIHDTATLTGVNGISLNGGATVTYYFFNNGGCSGTPTPAGGETKTVAVNGSVPDSSYQSLAAGSYSYRATYNGNANYNSKTSACEPFIVVTPSSPFTPGYWKNHQAHTTRLLPITLGNYTVDTFAKATAVFNNMNCSSTQINAAIGCLAGHLLATKLNLKNLSSSCIQPVVDKADAFLKGQVVSYGGYTATGINYIGPNASYSMNNNKRNLAIALKNAMDKYNNGGGC
jgi:hypothetical protein